MYDKSKVILFVLTLVFSVGFFGSTSYFLYENNQLKEKIEAQENKLKTATNQESKFEPMIVTFYKSLYTYQDSAKTADLACLNQLSSPEVYASIKKEIEVDQQGTPQQNVIRSSMIRSKELEIVPYKKSAVNQISYLVSVPIFQKINGEEIQFIQTEILSFNIKTKKIVKRQIILTEGSENNG